MPLPMAQGVVAGHSFFPPWKLELVCACSCGVRTVHTYTTELTSTTGHFDLHGYAALGRGAEGSKQSKLHCTCNHAVLHRHRPASLTCFVDLGIHQETVPGIYASCLE